MPSRFEEFDLSAVRTYPLASRPSKVRVEQFPALYVPGSGVRGLLASMPPLLGGAAFHGALTGLQQAHQAGAGLVWGIGAHVIKNGLGPLVIDLMERGYVTTLATNGAGVIHDFELAMAGHTSEDVEGTLGAGNFGMAEETGVLLNQAIREGVARGQGLGRAVGEFLTVRAPAYLGSSVVAAALRLSVPLTVHVAVGTDILHMHPAASGAALGEGSLRDFRIFTAAVSQLNGGVYVNCGSAVILPEVFLKAVALSRNAGKPLDRLTTVNIDFLRMYRPETNVVHRPTLGSGRGFNLVGPHEILLPLLAAALIDTGQR